ncbi:hypothetical protein LEMLEM_LOCUS16050 [Lemmus lemmus]
MQLSLSYFCFLSGIHCGSALFSSGVRNPPSLHCGSAVFSSGVQNSPSLHCGSTCHHLLTQQMNAESLANAGHRAFLGRLHSTFHHYEG